MPISFGHGRYTVVGLIGEGRHKRAFRCRDDTLSRDVAIIQVAAGTAAAASLTAGAEIAARLGPHPNIVTIHDIGREAEHEYVVAELMHGGDLRHALAATAPLDAEEVLRIGAEMCRALQHAHERGVVHSDVRPSNIWLTETRTVKVGDFGAQVKGDGAAATAAATDESRSSSSGYVAPEVAEGSLPAAGADLYSLGAVLYEMTTGQLPSAADTSLPDRPRRLNPRCPLALETVILRLLSRTAAARPESAATVALSLAAVETTALTANGDMLQTPEHGRLVGRERETERLHAALEQSLAGHPRVTLLVGEPGIGKTRLADELAGFAASRNAEVVHGRGYEEDGAPTYWPWMQIIRRLVHGWESERLRAELGVAAPFLAAIFPDLCERMQLTAPAHAADAEEARFRLGDALTRFLHNVARERPLLIVLDDLHWFDTPSLKLLGFVANELSGARILILGTYRDTELRRTHPLQQTLAALTRTRAVERVRLGGLSRADLRTFIELWADRSVPDGLIETIFRHTEGNPFFVSEVVRMLAEEGGLENATADDNGGWSLRIPAGIREVIGRRLDRLSDSCNAVLQVAAVVGREFPISVIEEIGDQDSSGPLHEALAARVLEDDSERHHWCRFSHALIQQTLLEELTTVERARIHGRVGTALERHYGARAASHAEELAHHFSNAILADGSNKALSYLRRAGEQALQQYEDEEAYRHFKRAIDIAETTGAAEAELAEIRAGLGRSSPSRDMAETRYGLKDVREVVSDGTRESRHQRNQLAAAIEYYVRTRQGSRAVDAIQHLEEAGSVQRFFQPVLSTLEPGSPEVGRLHLWAALRLLNEWGDLNAAEEAAQTAVAVASSRQLPALQAEGLKICAQILDIRQQPDRALQLLERARVLAEANGTLRAVVQIHAQSMQICLRAVDLRRARSHAVAARAAADALGVPHISALACIWQAEIPMFEGRWAKASALLDEALRATGRFGFPARGGRVRLIALMRRAQLAFQAGDVEEGYRVARILLTEVADVEPGPTRLSIYAGSALTHLVWLGGDPAWLELADRHHQALIAAGIRGPLSDVLAVHMYSGLSAVLRGPRDRAQRAYHQLSDTRFYWFYFIELDHVRALLAAFLGERDQAIAHFERSIAYQRRGLRPMLGRTCRDYASVLIDADQRNERDKAVALIEEADVIADELSMVTLQQELAALRARVGVPRGAAPVPAGLSTREAEVLALLAGGMTNKEIADQLGIGVRTVATHVQHILRKTGSPNRAGAAAFAAEHGLQS